MRMNIRVGKYNLEVVESKGILLVDNIKTTRQRKYRSLTEFYNEVNGVTENSVDRMLRLYGRNQPTVEENLEEQNEQLEELGINRDDIIEAYRAAMIKYISEYEYI